MDPRAKLAVEMGPLLLFFGSYVVAKRSVGDQQGMMVATGAFIAATLVALAYSYAVERRVSPVTLVTAVLVTGLGGLTIYLNDETFIKRKPTFVSGFIGSVLLIGLALGRPLVKLLMQGAIQMEDEGWRKLTLRWGLFMLLLAGMNEVVWRNFSTETWLTYKTFGILPLTFLFLIAQIPLISNYFVQTFFTPVSPSSKHDKHP
ncbi:MAG: septation protein A [Planctomycetota bacterium]